MEGWYLGLVVVIGVVLMVGLGFLNAGVFDQDDPMF